MKIVPKSIQHLTSGTPNAEQSFDGSIITGWFPGWNPANYPAKIRIEFDGKYKLSKIRIYDGPGQPILDFNSVNAGLSVRCTGYKTWTEFPYDDTTDYMFVSLKNIEGERVVPEIEFYGDPVSVDPPTPIELIKNVKYVLFGVVDNFSPVLDGDSKTGWEPKIRLRFDLGDEYDVRKIRFNAAGTNLYIEELNLRVEAKDGWHDNLNVAYTGQYITVQFSGGVVNEFEFYGKVSVVKPPEPPIKPIDMSIENRIGQTGFDWIPFDLLPTKILRQYQMLVWTWTGANGKIKVAPAKRGDANYDTYLQTAKDKGITVIFCPNKAPGWLKGENDNNWGEWMDEPLHPRGLDPKVPSSYIEFGKYAWQIAARYGEVSHPHNLLNVDTSVSYPNEPVNVKRTGLGLLKYFEVENEPDRPWKSPMYKYTAEEYAALLSAAYDGHCKTLGTTVGIKNADPKMNVVMGGISSMGLDYIRRMNDWFVANRQDKKFAADIINIHHYFNQSNPKLPNTDINLVNGAGVSPELDQAYDRMRNVMSWVDGNIPGVEVWLSEFGYDTVPPSTALSQHPKVYGGKSPEELQSMWVIRTFLISFMAGVHRSMVYNGLDENSASSGWLFGSSGLISGANPNDGKPAHTPKPVYHALRSLIEQLSGYKFIERVPTDDDNVYVLKFSTGTLTKYVGWVGTMDGSMVEVDFNGIPVQLSETPKVFI